MNRGWHIAMWLLWIGLLISCSEQPMSNRVIAQNDEFCVTGDSVITPDVTVWAVSPVEISNNLNLSSAERMLQRLAGSDTVPFCLTSGQPGNFNTTTDDNFPKYQSQQVLTDALYNLSVNDIKANYSQNGGFNSHQDHSALYGSLYLTLAMLDPQRAMTTLRNLVVDDLVTQKEGTWPVCDDRLGWPVAAWEVYCVTGDKQWLAEAYRVTVRTLDEEIDIQQNRLDGLMHGGQLSRYRAGDFFPEWSVAVDLTDMASLINNVLAVRALEVANSMAEELEQDLPYAQEAQRLRESINQQLWDENRGRYSAYLLGIIDRRRAPLCDNIAQALSVVWDLADDDRSTTLIEKTPVSHRGVPSVYPVQQLIEPHLQHPSWTLTQAFWNVAAAQSRNEHALRRGLAALYRAQALYQPQHMSIEGRPVNYLSCATANLAMIYRVLAGMHFTPDGIEFAPMVPSCMPGNKTILNFTYRNATLDITLVGTGNDIKLMTLDGKTVEGDYLPGDLEGHHNVLIKLQQGKTSSSHVTLMRDIRLPSTPVVSWQGDSCLLRGWQQGLGYKLVINGIRSYSISDSTFKLPPLGMLADVSVVAVNRHGFSLPTRPIIIPYEKPIVTALSDSTLRGDSLMVTVTVDHAGSYLLSADFTITEGCDLILVGANDHYQGALIMPSTAAGGWQCSNHIAVMLLRGENRLMLRRYHNAGRATVSQLTLHKLLQARIE